MPWFIVDAGPGMQLNALYRARVFQSNEKLTGALERPDIELGPPPPRSAIAGRMNARGIAVFYGATDPDVALAETRPPVGSKVAVGRFEILRPLRLLDIEVLRKVYVDGSVFDRAYAGQLEKAKFLRSISHRITAPVMPDDELFEYLVTQAIADYLAGRNEPAIDGIIYPSAQNGGNSRNVVLFHKTARVEPLDIPSGATISASLYYTDEDGPTPDYSVHEEVPPPEEAPKMPSEAGFSPELFLWPGPPGDDDTRAKTLRVDTSSVVVSHIGAVAYGKTSYDVSRRRSERRKPEF